MYSNDSSPFKPDQCFPFVTPSRVPSSFKIPRTLRIRIVVGKWDRLLPRLLMESPSPADANVLYDENGCKWRRAPYPDDQAHVSQPLWRGHNFSRPPADPFAAGNEAFNMNFNQNFDWYSAKTHLNDDSWATSPKGVGEMVTDVNLSEQDLRSNC